MYNKNNLKKVAKIFGSFKKLSYLCGALRKQVKIDRKKNKKKLLKYLQVSKKSRTFASELRNRVINKLKKI